MKLKRLPKLISWPQISNRLCFWAFGGWKAQKHRRLEILRLTLLHLRNRSCVSLNASQKSRSSQSRQQPAVSYACCVSCYWRSCQAAVKPSNQIGNLNLESSDAGRKGSNEACEGHKEFDVNFLNFVISNSVKLFQFGNNEIRPNYRRIMIIWADPFIKSATIW